MTAHFKAKNWVMRFALEKEASSICDYPFLPILFLVQDGTQTNGTGISMQLKGFGKANKDQDRGRGAQNFQCIKGFLAFICPLNFSFLMSCIIARHLIIEGMIAFSINLNEASIIVCEPQEGS